MKLLRRLGFPIVAALAAALSIGAGSAAAATPHGLNGLSCRAPGRQPVTVVLVHGAFAQPSSWDGEVGELQRAGCNVHAIGNPVQDLTTDAETVADYVRTIPGPVLLVGHSYGGSVITNAAAEVHNVVGLVYVDAAAPAVGETTASLSGANSVLTKQPMSKLYTMFPYPGAPAGASDLLLQRNIFVHDFANSLPPAQALRLWAEQPPASSAALMAPSQYAAWQTIPSWFFISTGDRIITPREQFFMARRAHSHITVFHGGSHLTLVSNPTAVTATIGRALHYTLSHGS